jgi:hypothetical protein
MTSPAPVIMEASSEARKTMPLAKSFGVPSRPIPVQRGVGGERKEEASQRSIQDRAWRWRRFPGRRRWRSCQRRLGLIRDDEQLEARAGEACGRAVCAWQKGAGGRGCAEVIDDLHRKIGQLQVERDFLAGQPAISRVLRGGR